MSPASGGWRGCSFASFQLCGWDSNLLNLYCLSGAGLLFSASSSQCSVLWQVSASHRALGWGCTQTLLCTGDALAGGLSVLWREWSPHWTCRMWKSTFGFPCTLSEGSRLNSRAQGMTGGRLEWGFVFWVSSAPCRWSHLHGSLSYQQLVSPVILKLCVTFL